ncbi:STAS domain-containing protein [Couchioplanes caeruleus]|uniref:STAS domain-containing protein n=1 Tax=Couchioplanes caeruleus TaxID=56438 RepID=UPI0020BD5685|nr:STAS domain-containing protein [Couchioplanes caeruleus]UQU62644.1 STAS domain-containing protein [Couchioplanes caeruleus]
MTVVPGAEGAAVLICDTCGGHDSTVDVTRDRDLVWPVVTALGWTGSAFATGPHRCPRCNEVPGTARWEPREHHPASHSASYDLRTHDDVDAAAITPLADLDAVLAERLRDDLMHAATAHRHVLVDLHAVHFIDSAALGLLVRARQEAKQHGATFDLVAPSRFVRAVLHTMRLDSVFRTFPDMQSAVDTVAAADGRW